MGSNERHVRPCDKKASYFGNPVQLIVLALLYIWCGPSHAPRPSNLSENKRPPPAAYLSPYFTIGPCHRIITVACTALVLLAPRPPRLPSLAFVEIVRSLPLPPTQLFVERRSSGGFSSDRSVVGVEEQDVPVVVFARPAPSFFSLSFGPPC